MRRHPCYPSLWFWLSYSLSLGLLAAGGDALAASSPVAIDPLFADSSLETLETTPRQLALVRYRRRAYSRPAWGIPYWAYGGAARGDGCKEPDASPVVPLVPVDFAPSATENPDSNTSFLGMTGQAFPSFLFYVPETTAIALDFVVIDDKRHTPDPTDGVVIYQQRLPLTQTPGIVRFDLESAEVGQALTPEVHYTWSLTLVCESTDTVDLPFVSGLIQRQPLTADEQAAIAAVVDPEARINAYAEAGLWHETLAELADRYCEHPDDAAIAQDWESLLNSLDLANAPELVRQIQTDTIAAAPLLWCAES